MSPEEIGKRLRVLRGDRTMNTVAHAVGITQSALSNYENGIRVPRDATKVELANYYGVSVESLFYAPVITNSNIRVSQAEQPA